MSEAESAFGAITRSRMLSFLPGVVRDSAQRTCDCVSLGVHGLRVTAQLPTTFRCAVLSDGFATVLFSIHFSVLSRSVRLQPRRCHRSRESSRWTMDRSSRSSAVEAAAPQRILPTRQRARRMSPPLPRHPLSAMNDAGRFRVHVQQVPTTAGGSSVC